MFAGSDGSTRVNYSVLSFPNCKLGTVKPALSALPVLKRERLDADERGASIPYSCCSGTLAAFGCFCWSRYHFGGPTFAARELRFIATPGPLLSHDLEVALVTMNGV